MERWGVPLRPVDVAELEYREWYVQHNGPQIRQWGEDNRANYYAGYWVDHRAGGVVRVGFTSDQAGSLASLAGSGLLVATERLSGFSSQPERPVSELVSLQMAIGIEDGPSLKESMTTVGVDVAGNVVRVGATNVGSVASALSSHYGSAAPIQTYHDPEGGPASARFTINGPVKAGQRIGAFRGFDSKGKKEYDRCTASPVARERVGTKANGQPQVAYFLLTAGHCFNQGDKIVRFASNAENPDVAEIGEQRSRRWQIYEDKYIFEDDGAAVRLDATTVTSTAIIGGPHVKGVAKASEGTIACISLGEQDRVECKPIRSPEVLPYTEEPHEGPFWQVPLKIKAIGGDSGSPVYTPSGYVLGIEVHKPEAGFTPLLALSLPEAGPYPYLKPQQSQAPGLLNRAFMGNLNVLSD